MDLFGITAFIVAHKFWIGFVVGLFIGANLAVFVVGLFMAPTEDGPVPRRMQGYGPAPRLEHHAVRGHIGCRERSKYYELNRN